jgi:hypothetical protein
MASIFRSTLLIGLLCLALLTSCSKKSNCPAYLGHWPGSSEKQQASDGKKSAGEKQPKKPKKKKQL